MNPSTVGNIIEELFLSSKKRIIGSIVITILILSIPVTVMLTNQQQDIRQRAASVDFTSVSSDSENPSPSPTLVKYCGGDDHVSCEVGQYSCWQYIPSGPYQGTFAKSCQVSQDAPNQINCIQCIMVTPSPTRKPSPSPALSATPSISQGTTVALAITLPGIGPNTTLGENNEPQHLSRSFDVYAYDGENHEAEKTTTTLTYNNGVYSGNATFNTIASGPYTIKVNATNSLIKAVPGIHQLSQGATVNIPPVVLVSGDIRSNGSSKNLLDIDDYSILLSCYAKTDCTNEYKILSDLNDNGVMDPRDLNILLRGFATRKGD
jgi:hypothetical protein